MFWLAPLPRGHFGPTGKGAGEGARDSSSCLKGGLVGAARIIVSLANGTAFEDPSRPRQWPPSAEMNPMKNKWNWYDPPILFPLFLVLLIVGYAILRTPQ